MKIGILGGTFDPIHKGHLALARYALKQFKLDRVFFIPAARPPHKKSSKPVASVKHRLAMVRCALRGSKHFKISELEIKRRGPSYTVDTLKAFRRKFPTAKLFLILGQDSYAGLRHWKEPAKIVSFAHLLVAKRRGSAITKKIPAYVSWLRMPFYIISSSQLREAIKKGEKIDDDLPTTVMRYIKTHHLYLK